MRPRTTLSFVTLILLVVALASSWTGCSDAPTGADAALDVVAKTRFREALSAELQLEQGDDGFSLPISNAPLRGRAPLLADGALHLENASGQWIEVRAISRKPVAPMVSGNAAVYSDAETATDVVITLSRDRAEEFRVLRDPRAPLRIEYEVVLGPGIVGLQEDRNRVVAFDEEGRGAFRTLQAMAIDSSGSERALHVELVENEEGFRIVLELDAVGLSYPILVDPSWIMDGYWPPDVLVALGSISTGEDVTVNGNVSVQDAATQTLDGSELFVGPGSDIWGNAAADNAELQAQAVVHGSLSHNGLVLGTGAHATSGYLTPVTLPLAGDVPVMPLFQAGTTSVNVPNNATQTRSAGSYGTVTIGRRATLRLAGGVYNIESLTMGGPSTLQCDAPCDVRVKGRVAMDAATRIIPAPAVHPNPALPIEDVRIFVDGSTRPPQAARRARWSWGRRLGCVRVYSFPTARWRSAPRPMSKGDSSRARSTSPMMLWSTVTVARAGRIVRPTATK
jgi:hypothetical protein